MAEVIIDSFEFDYGKWLIRISSLPDDGSMRSPIEEYGEDGAYTAAQEKAWRNDEWQWVTLQVEAVIDGITLGTAHLGGVESGYIPDDEGNERKFLQARGTTLYTTGYYDPTQDLVCFHDMAEEAVEEGEETLRKLASHVTES